MKNTLIRFILLTISLSTLTLAQNAPKFSGVAYTDYFYNIDNSIPANKDLNGFQIRRIYFTTDFSVADNFDSRFRLETDQSASSNTAGGKLGVMVKDAYLKWKGIFSGSDLVVGISPTPAFDISEAAWSYRSLEKTILDLNGIVSSRDFGIDLKGKLTESGNVSYWFKYGNNSSNSPETNKYKRYYALFRFKLSDQVQATINADYASNAQKFDTVDKTSKANNQVVASLFVGYKPSDNFSAGVEAFTRSIQNNYRKSATETLSSQSSFGFSVWAWGSLSESYKLVGRFDNYDPNTSADLDAKSLIMAGLDYKAAKNVSVIPNFQYVSYQAKDASGKALNDLTARVTFAYSF